MLQGFELHSSSIYTTFKCSLPLSSCFRVNLQADDVQPNVPEQKIAALYDLYFSTNGTNWEWNGYFGGMEWNFTDPKPCADLWMGITCSDDPTPDGDLHVLALSLYAYALRGTLPDSLCDLTQMTFLQLGNNFLSGTIPANFGLCLDLEELYLDSNALIGSIPFTLGNCSNLNTLQLFDNSLTGSIPDSIGHCTLLQDLDLHGNFLTGPIPQTFEQCSQLYWLNLYQNKLNGTIPISLQNCTQLDTISLYDNLLTGTIPPLLISLENLQTLALYNNRLTGHIPQVVGTCAFLDNINLSGNFLTGSVPSSFGNCTDLVTLDFHNNRLNGSIPESFSNFGRISRMNLGENQLTGHVPFIGDSCFDLTSLILNGNILTGAIPNWLESCEGLRVLDMSSNKFTGTLPRGFLEPSSSLLLIQCSHNLLTGNLPNITSDEKLFVYVLDLSNNKFSGTIPGSFVQALFGVYRLYLGNNLFTGALPNEWSALALTATILSLQNNAFSGTIPDSLGDLALLQTLNLTANRFTGDIPISFQRLSVLQSLLLKDNQLRGNVSNIFSSRQKNLTIVQLSGNQLTGTLPANVFLLHSLQSFAAVSNCFDGPLPVHTICQSKSLSALILDGFHSASTCKRQVSLTNELFRLGTLPPCLLTMNKLTTLHLSGSGLTGALPTSSSISPMLTDLSLSHNLLTGEMPGNLLRRDWSNLDLSFNRLTGTILAFRNASFGKHTELYLDHNRLSGVIPGSILDASSLSILESNLFSCRIDRKDVPAQDPVSNKYTCGSDAVNNTFYVWLGCTAVAALIAWFIWSGHIFGSIRNWYAESEVVPLVGIEQVMRLARQLVILGAGSALYCTVVLLPTYGAFVAYDPTFTYQYAWTLSGAYLTGSTAFWVETVLLQLQLPLCGWLASSLGLLRLSVFARSNSVETNNIAQVDRIGLRLLNGTILLTSVTVVAGANVAFVIATLNFNGRVLTLIQILLALFKLGFNNYALPALQKLINKHFAKHWCGDDLHNLVVSKVVLALINVMVIPCIVVLFISPDCFYDALVGSKEVTSSFEYLGLCDTISITTTDGALNPVSCLSGAPEQEQTSYTPPFSYSYQCSSSFVTFYAPTFVIMCIISAFIIPFNSAVLIWIQGNLTTGSPMHSVVRSFIPRLLRDLPSAEALAESRKESTSRPLFLASQLMISLLVYLALLLTYGAIFPPLAVCCVVAMISLVICARVEVGHFIFEARISCRQDCIDEVDRGCSKAISREVLQTSLLLVFAWSCMFYTLFLFDTLGNDVGLIGAFWVLIFFPVLPLIVFVVFRCAREFFTRRVVVNAEVGIELADLPDKANCGLESGTCSSISPMHSI